MFVSLRVMGWEMGSGRGDVHEVTSPIPARASVACIIRTVY